MMKFRAILTSLLLLLIFGVNENAWAGVDANEEVASPASSEKSDDKSQNEEENEKITDWDFFGAFSLVNVQLQWRDLHLGVVNEPTQTESSEGHQDISFEVAVTDFFKGKDQLVPVAVLPSLPFFAVRSSFSGANEYLKSSCDYNAQSEQTIAYIQNCGTYPTQA